MSNDGEPLAKQSTCTVGNDTESRNEMQIIETERTTKLLHLNDYCLDEIFGYLNVSDLCSLSRVCKRFWQRAELVFKWKFSEFDFSTSNSSQRARNVLRIFGHVIKSVNIPRKAFPRHAIVGHVEDGLLKDIVECCGKTLHTLKMKNFRFTLNAVRTLNMLKSLQSLSLVGCSTNNCAFHLSNFSSLRTLRIIDTFECYALTGKYPALEFLELEKVIILHSRFLEQFIVEHKQLETLIISRCRGISTDVISLIGSNMQSLKQLYFDENLIPKYEPIERIQNNILHLSELKNLQWIKLYCGCLSIGKLLAKMLSNEIPMKTLFFGYGIVDDETVKAIKKIKTMEGLGFCQTNGLKNQYLIEIAQAVPQLKELYIEFQRNITFVALKKVLCYTKQLRKLQIASDEFRLDPSIYNEILDIVKERRNAIKLTIRIKSTLYVQDLISQQTIDMNKIWLIIERVRINYIEFLRMNL